MKNILALTAFVTTATLAAVAPAMAGTTNGTITVGSSTAALCTSPTAVAVALGNYDGTAAVTGTTNVLFKCTNTSTGTITLSSASTSATGAGNLINQSLASTTPVAYTFTGHNTSDTGSGLVGGATDISLPVNVTVAAGQNPAPANYLDTINVTVTY